MILNGVMAVILCYFSEIGSFQGALRKRVSSQNVPLSKRPTVKTSHTQNVPSQNAPFLKQNVPVGQNVPSQNVPMLMNWCNGFV